MIDVKGKWCLITGGCRGVGRLTAIEMAKLGANIILQGRDKAHAEPVLAEIKKLGVGYNIIRHQMHRACPYAPSAFYAVFRLIVFPVLPSRKEQHRRGAPGDRRVYIPLRHSHHWAAVYDLLRFPFESSAEFHQIRIWRTDENEKILRFL